MKKCSTKRCRNRIKIRKYCDKCRRRIADAKNPIRYAYQNLKKGAVRRNIPFELTLEQFSLFCVATSFLVGKGREKNTYSIDRIDPSKGYTITNIQVLTLEENRIKGKKILHYDWTTKTAYVETKRGTKQIWFDE